MAMTIEKAIQKLEKILNNLDNAIEERDLAKVDDILNNQTKKFNARTEGEVYENILTKLEEKIKYVVEEIKEESDISDKIKLANIQKSLIKGKDPFLKTKSVIDSLNRKGVNQEDLKRFKEDQKADNEVQIDAIKSTNQELAVGIADIENRYIDKIRVNDEAIEIIKEIKKQKDLLVGLDPTLNAETVASAKEEIRNKMSELGSKGVDVTSIQNFDSNPNIIDSFVSTKTNEIMTDSNNIAVGIISDTTISPKLVTTYGLRSVTNAKDLKDKFKELVRTRQKNVSKISTLQAENVQIDKTISKLRREQEIRSFAYDANGNVKREEDIETAVLYDAKTRRIVEDEISQKYDFDSKSIFERFGARMSYYKNEENAGRVKSFFKALTSRTNNVKKLATSSEAVKLGIEMSDKAKEVMEKRQNNFKATIKREAAKKISKDPTLLASDIRDDVVEKAYKKAVGDDETVR